MEYRWLALARRGRPVSLRQYLGGLLFFSENEAGWSKILSRMRFLQQQQKKIAPLTSGYTAVRQTMLANKLHVNSFFSHAALPSLVRVFGHRLNASVSSSSSVRVVRLDGSADAYCRPL